MLDDALQDYILESQELLRCMEKALLCIRHSTNPTGMINAISKAVRSLKTSAVLYKQDDIVIVAKEMENILDQQLRRSEMDMEDDKVRKLLFCCGIIKTLLKNPVALMPTVN